MLRNHPGPYTPHALLLASAMLGLSFTMSDPQPEPASDIVVSSHTGQTHAQATQHFDRSYMHAQGRTRSLAEVLAKARVRFERVRQNRPEQAEEARASGSDQQAPIAEPQQRRMVRRQDVAWVAPADPRFSEPYAEFVTQADQALPANPDALPGREYEILEYGDVGGAEPEDAEKTAPADRARVLTAPIDVPGLDNTPTADNSITASATPTHAQTTHVTIPSTAVGTPPATTSSISTVQPTAASQPAVTATQTITVQPASASARAVTVRQRETTTELATPKEPTATNSPALTDAGQAARSSEPHISQTATPSVTLKTSPNALVTAEPRAQAAATPDKSPTPQAGTSRFQPTVQTPTYTGNNSGKTTDKGNKTNIQQSLVVLVDDYDQIGSDRFNAIDNALKEINQATKQAGIALELALTTDPGAGHNILLREQDNDTLGGKLGLAQSASAYDDHGNEFRLGQESAALGGLAVASINKAVNWFAGDDIFDIKQDQFDYQTAVTHELLHLLGLDDDFGNDQSLVMHGYLSPGETRRAIEEAEQTELASRYADANLWDDNAKSNGKSARYSRQGIQYRSEALTAAPVPEPAIALLMGWGIACQAWRRRH